jgi:hypothetical protein
MNRMQQYLKERREQRWEEKHGMIGAIVCCILLGVFIIWLWPTY